MSASTAIPVDEEPATILPPSTLVTAMQLDIVSMVEEALRGCPASDDTPADHLFMPESVRLQTQPTCQTPSSLPTHRRLPSFCCPPHTEGAAEGLVNPAPILYGKTGQNVTIHSRMKEISNYYTYISWYRLRPSGKVEHLAYFGSFTAKYGRYTGELPKGSENAHLNVSGATIGDSGRFFAVEGTSKKLTPGSSSVLVITDPEVLPVMRVFLSRTGTALCELKGGGPHWSDPKWETDDAKQGLKLLQPEAETFIDEHGAFIRSSILSLEEGIRGLNCVCQHITGVIIRTRVIQARKDQCQLLLYLSLTASGLWAWTQQ
ncbi:uncharacterized protein LOC133133435 [Conger conger]|uniref:uncharacterized protein LOC133133435 n=1 Tax=Conger conger TaxID=82655 RepID=UPI002A5AB174|nr:uncharacterized protein LOC133133435 [Conger conger]